jgi:WD40-like Beta Propeller Repeat
MGAVRYAVLAVLAACTFRPLPGSSHGDAATIDAPPATGPWSAPTRVDELVPGGGKDDPTLTGDMLEMYFNACPTDCKIFVTSRSTIDMPWSTPTVVAEVDSTALESTPEVTSDGLWMYFTSERSGGLGSDDIYLSYRADRSSVWGAPTLATMLSSSSAEYGSAPDDAQLRMVLNSDRAPSQGEDLWEATRGTTADRWSAPAQLENVNSPSSDLSPFLSADDLTLYFHSDRGGSDDLYVATRPSVDAPFGAPQPIAELDSSDADDDPWVSPDGHTMFFASDRDSPGTLQIYEAHR